MSDSQIEVGRFSDCDLRALAELHLAAYRGYMNAGIGRRYVEQFLNWFTKRDDRIALKVEVDGVPAGYVVGGPLGDQPQMNHDLLFHYAWGALTHPWVLLGKRYRTSALAKLKRIVRKKLRAQPPPLTRDPAQRWMSLTSIVVGPQFAGRGAGQALMRAFERRARELQYDLAELSVYADNARARAVYEKCGWEVFKEDERLVCYKKLLAADQGADQGHGWVRDA